MSFGQGPTVQFDSDFQNFIEAERQASRFNFLVHDLNDKCWDLCISKITSHLKPNTETCLINCVERFLDSTSFVLNHFQKTQSYLARQDSMSFE